MTPVAVVAAGAVSPLGRGEAATSVGPPGAAPVSMVRDDAELTRAGLRRPRGTRVPADALRAARDRAQAILEAAARELVGELDREVQGWRERRLALAIGTSAGGMPSLEQALALRSQGKELDGALARASLYDGPLAVLATLFGPAARLVNVLGACMASTFAIGLGCRWLEAGSAELVIAGGYDALSAFLAAGFEALGATTAALPLPFRAARDGMVLGEGAALLALVRPGDARPRPKYGFVLGFGATSDATHVTAPDPAGGGLARAARRALEDAALGPQAIELVSAHATSTPHNDSSETRALASVFGDGLEAVVVHPFKASIGHTLGAAGALETLAAFDAMRSGVLPAAHGTGALEADFRARLLAENQVGSAQRCLKLSAAFGGSNAALVLGSREFRPGPGAARPRRKVARRFEGSLVTTPDLELIARCSRLDEVRRARLERASALAITAVALALEELGPLPLETTGVIVGTAAASLEADELFDARRRERPAAGVEPRRFPATSPNLPAGACSIAFGFRGPSLAVGGGPVAAGEAVAVAEALVVAGDADAMVVVACNDVGPTTRALFCAAGCTTPEDGARVLVLVPTS